MEECFKHWNINDIYILYQVFILRMLSEGQYEPKWSSFSNFYCSVSNTKCNRNPVSRFVSRTSCWIMMRSVSLCAVYFTHFGQCTLTVAYAGSVRNHSFAHLVPRFVRFSLCICKFYRTSVINYLSERANMHILSCHRTFFEKVVHFSWSMSFFNFMDCF